MQMHKFPRVEAANIVLYNDLKAKGIGVLINKFFVLLPVQSLCIEQKAIKLGGSSLLMRLTYKRLR